MYYYHRAEKLRIELQSHEMNALTFNVGIMWIRLEILLMDEAKNMSDQFDSKLHCRKGKSALAHYLCDLHSLENNR